MREISENAQNCAEICKLAAMLDAVDIPYTWIDRTSKWYHPEGKFYQIIYPIDGPMEKWIVSVIEGPGTYGGYDDLLEIRGLLTPEEEQADSVAGYLTANDVFERIRKHWEAHQEEILNYVGNRLVGEEEE